MIIRAAPTANHNNDDQMKERQRWQPEEDSILKAYVKQYGPKEWNLISQRMGKTLNRDPKSCLERWKNYLKPGIKKGSLTPEEQSLVISLQAKYGNKWKKIASEVPGRTAKRLGKWWEVFKEKQSRKEKQKREYSDQQEGNIPVMVGSGSCSSPERVAQGRYDHILETFAEKYVQPKHFALQAFNLNLNPVPSANAVMPNLSLGADPEPVLSLGSGSLWNHHTSCSSLSSSTSSTTTASPSVNLSLSPSEPGLEPGDMNPVARFMPGQQMGNLVQYCKELEEGRQSWMQHKKEATWRLSRLEQQLESEKARKRREKIDEIETKLNFAFSLNLKWWVISHNITMAAAGGGKLEVEIEVKSSADKFWGSIRDSTTLFPKAFSHDYKSIQVLEGDGKAPGSVRLITYAEGSPIVKVSTEKIEHVDEANKVVAYKVIDGDLLKYYKAFKGIISVTSKGDNAGSLVKWACEFEKASDDIPDPSVIKEFAIKNFKEVDDYIQKA